MTKTWTKTLATVAAVAAATLTGCGTPIAPAALPVAGLEAAPTATIQAVGRPLRTIPAATARRLLQASDSAAVLWGIDYRYSFLDKFKTERYVKGHERTLPNGKKVWKKGGYQKVTIDNGWETEASTTGDGDVVDRGFGKMLYRVPAGRVLVINRVIKPSRVSINDFNIGWGEREFSDDLDKVNYVFGPGEAVAFSFPITSRNSSNKQEHCHTKLSGFTADPAIFGGGFSGGGAAGDGTGLDTDGGILDEEGLAIDPSEPK